MKNEKHKLLGKKLKDLRKRDEKTLREVEKKASISNSYLCQLEKGMIKNPSVFVIDELAIYYQVDINFLLGDSFYDCYR